MIEFNEEVLVSWRLAGFRYVRYRKMDYWSVVLSPLREDFYQPAYTKDDYALAIEDPILVDYATKGIEGMTIWIFGF